jgi:regulatory protein
MKAAGPLTLEELERAALRYLERFDSSAANLRRILLRHVHKVARERGKEAAENGPDLVDALLRRYVESGIVSDARFADVLAQGLRRRGSSSRAIMQKLRTRGVAEDVAHEALSLVDRDAEGSAELAAAKAYVRRRRLGVFRPAAERTTNRQKDLARLARAGFGYDIAKAALGTAENDDDPVED